MHRIVLGHEARTAVKNMDLSLQTIVSDLGKVEPEREREKRLTEAFSSWYM